MRKQTIDARLSRFGRFLAINNVPPKLVADLAGVSRQHVYRLRYRKSEPTRPVMIALMITCRQITRRAVQMYELFNLGDGEQ